MQINSTRIKHQRHGLSESPEYLSWGSMKQRCLNPRCKAYPYYGGRGITICPEWIASFATFYRDMGPRPSPKHTLERVNNNQGYSPDNCKWVTRKEQGENRRHPTSITYNNETRSIADWAKHLNVSYQILYHRLLRHPADDILSMRLQPNRRRGEAVKTSVLTESQVREMRRLHDEEGLNYTKAGKCFNVDRRYARRIIRREVWKHVV